MLYYLNNKNDCLNNSIQFNPPLKTVKKLFTFEFLILIFKGDITAITSNVSLKLRAKRERDNERL